MILQCPNCSKPVDVPEGAPGGQLMRCKSCEGLFRLPEKAADAPEAKLPEADPAPQFTPAPRPAPIELTGPPAPPPEAPPGPMGPLPKPKPGVMPEDQAERMRRLAESKGVGFDGTPAGPTTPLPHNAALPPAPPVPDWTQTPAPKLETEGSPLDRFGMRVGGATEPADPNAAPAFATGTPDQAQANAGELARQQAEDAAAEEASRKAAADRQQAEAGTQSALKNAYAGANAQKQSEAMQQGVSDVANLPILRDLVQAFQPLVRAVSGATETFRTLFGGKAPAGLREASGGGGGKGGGGGPPGPEGAGEGKGEGGGKGMAAAGAGVGGAIGQALGSASIGGGIGAALGALASVTAGLVQTFSQLTAAAGQFVQTFNPSLTAQLAYTFRDLQAVIGQALVPWIQQAARSTRFLADALVEPMRSLRPVVAQLAAAFGGVMNSLSSALGQTLTALAPAFGVLAQVVDAVGSAIRGVVSLFQAVGSVLSPFIGAISGVLSAVMVPVQGLGSMFADLMRAVGAVAAGLGAWLEGMLTWVGTLFGGAGNWMSQLGTAIQGAVAWLTKFALTAAALAAQFLGMSGFVKGMIRSLEGPKEGASTGTAAAHSAQVTSVESWSKSLMAAAFTSQAVGPDDKKADPMQGVIDALKEIENGSGTVITDAIVAAVPALASAITNAAGRAASSAAGAAAEYVGGGFYGAGRAAANWLGLGGGPAASNGG